MALKLKSFNAMSLTTKTSSHTTAANPRQRPYGRAAYLDRRSGMLLYNKVTPYSRYMADTLADHSFSGHTHIPDASAPGGESALAFRPRTGGTHRKSCRKIFL